MRCISLHSIPSLPNLILKASTSHKVAQSLNCLETLSIVSCPVTQPKKPFNILTVQTHYTLHTSHIMGINPVFNKEVVGRRGGSAPCCVSMSILPRCVSSVCRVSCIVVAHLHYTSISAQSNPIFSLRFMISYGCRSNGDMLGELGEQGAVCTESESLLSTAKHVILWRIIVALSSAHLEKVYLL